ncbi:MAG TPA: hypothetical protein VGE97_00175 [Nitrososphaera sp.]|jgi:hypothetical protein
MPTEQQIQFRAKIASLEDFNETFELVKAAVQKKFKLHRAGLSLILQIMPSTLGAYHMLGSNAIVVNTYLLSTVKKLVKSKEEYNSYVFMVLAHEYFHSLGIVDESTVRQMTFELCTCLLGDDHFAAKLAKEGPAAIYPQLRQLMQSQFGTAYHVVRNFDKTNQTYIQ